MRGPASMDLPLRRLHSGSGLLAIDGVIDGASLRACAVTSEPKRAGRCVVWDSNHWNPTNVPGWIVAVATGRSGAFAISGDIIHPNRLRFAESGDLCGVWEPTSLFSDGEESLAICRSPLSEGVQILRLDASPKVVAEVQLGRVHLGCRYSSELLCVGGRDGLWLIRG